MNNSGRMKVKDLANQVHQDTKIVRQKLTNMGYSTFSDESEVSREACEKLIAMLESQAKAPIKVSDDNAKKQEGVVRRVLRDNGQKAAEAPKDNGKIGVADSGLRSGLATVKAEDKAAAADAAEKDKPKVRRKVTEQKPEAEAEVKAEPEAKAEPEKKAEPEIKAEPEAKAESEKKAEPETKAEPEIKAVPEKKDEPKAKAKPEKKAETEKTTEPEKTAENKSEESAGAEPQETKAPEVDKPAKKEQIEATPVAPVKQGRSAFIASSNESFSFDLGSTGVSATRQEFDRARQEATATRSRVRRETGTDNAITRRTERQNQERQKRFQSRDGDKPQGKFGGKPQGGYESKGSFDKDSDYDDKQRRTQSPNKTQGQKQNFEHVEQNLGQRREKTGDKDNAKKEKRLERESARHAASPAGAKEGKYNDARMFIGNSMGVSEVESDEFSYSGNFDVNSRNRKQAKKKDKEAEAARKEAQKLTKVKIPPTITVKEFAERIKKTGAEVVKKLFMLGIMATMNQEIDFDTAALVANDFEIEAEPEIVVTDEEILLEDPEDLEVGEDAEERPPVVVVMGHVDHGKTSLLDAIRNTSVTAGEAGGITQHIGAYSVTINGHKITFLDTPGHEAFTAMRARGAQVTDVAIIVVAADDGVMPQTIEAINHAKAANVSIVVAVNKIDKEGANVDRVRNEMAEQGIVCEEWGGDVPFVEVSAKMGKNIDTLLETVILSADILELKASKTKQCKGTVIEAKLDKNKGPVATLLVQRGTLRSGDAILTETTFGHIRTMTSDKGRTIKEAGPSTPVEVTGLPEVPEAGKVFYVVNKDEKLAKKIADERMNTMRQNTMSYSNKVTLEGLFSQMKAGELKDLNIIVKADVKGSAEAIKASLEKLSNDEVRVCVIHNGVGGISESDVLLAEASNAVIIGFNVRPIVGIGEMAAEKGVDMKLYRVIYDAIDDVKAAMVGMLKPEFKENVIGHVEIRQTFKISGVGTIAGGYVLDGKVVRNSKARIVRDSIVIYEGNLASLKRFKDDVKEVASGYECGLSFENFDDLKEGDVIESYIMEEIQRTL